MKRSRAGRGTWVLAAGLIAVGVGTGAISAVSVPADSGASPSEESRINQGWWGAAMASAGPATAGSPLPGVVDGTGDSASSSSSSSSSSSVSVSVSDNSASNIAGSAQFAAAPRSPRVPTVLSSMTGQVELAGVYSPRDKIAVANLTVTPHEYTIAVDFEARMVSSGLATTLTCGVIDNNGLRRFFITDDRPVRSAAGWEHHSIAAQVSLPDLTMGLRCVPDQTAVISVAFRDIAFSATEVDRGRRIFYP